MYFVIISVGTKNSPFLKSLKFQRSYILNFYRVLRQTYLGIRDFHYMLTFTRKQSDFLNFSCKYSFVYPIGVYFFVQSFLLFFLASHLAPSDQPSGDPGSHAVSTAAAVMAAIGYKYPAAPEIPPAFEWSLPLSYKAVGLSSAENMYPLQRSAASCSRPPAQA